MCGHGCCFYSVIRRPKDEWTHGKKDNDGRLLNGGKNGGAKIIEDPHVEETPCTILEEERRVIESALDTMLSCDSHYHNFHR